MVWGRDVKSGVLITKTVVTTAEVDDTSQGEHGDREGIGLARFREEI